MISGLLTTLYGIGLELTSEEIADALWLTEQIKQSTSHNMVMKHEDTDSYPVAHETIYTNRDTRPLPQLDDVDEMQAFEDTSPEQISTSSDMYLHSERVIDTEKNNQHGLPIRSPAASALPATLDIARALRPLMRRISSKKRFVLDEEATVTQIAEEGIWSPVLKALKERWLEVALVVDEGASMVIWQQTIKEFRFLLEHHGAFRDVRTWGLVTDAIDGAAWIHRGTGADAHSKQKRNPRELLDSQGRRLIILVTDCVSPIWLNDAITPILDMWSHTNPMVMVQMLPQRLWYRTALGIATATHLRSPAPGVANTQLIVKDASLGKQSLSSICMPVVTLEAKPFLAWARMVVGTEGTFAPGFLIERYPSQEIIHISENSDEFTQGEALSANERVYHFRTSSSPLARQLASLLAAAPISLPVARLIQQSMLPESRQVHLAEVFLGGLLEEEPVDADDPDYIQYEFIDGVRELLLNSLSVSDSLQVLTTVSNFIGIHFGQNRDFQALLVTPNISEDGLVIDERSKPFARVAAKVLGRLGGKYSTLAAQLGSMLYPPALPPTLLLPSTPTPAPYLLEEEKESPPIRSIRRASSNRLSEGLYIKRRCPRCYIEFYPGECEIVSGITGRVLKSAPRNWWQRVNARWNPEPLSGPHYTLELAYRVCPNPNCGYLLPQNIERIDNLTIAIIGDVASGVSTYLTALLYQTEQEWIKKSSTTYIQWKCLTPDIEGNLKREYFRPLFDDHLLLHATHPSVEQPVPLIYELTVKTAQKPSRKVNLIFHDKGSGIHQQENLGLFSRYVLNASAIIFLADPLVMPQIAEALPPFLTYSYTIDGNNASVLNPVLQTITHFRGLSSASSLSIPIAIALSKSDLLKYLTMLHHPYHFLQRPTYNSTLNIADMKRVDREVRGVLADYGENSLLMLARNLKYVQFFAVAPTGSSPDKNGIYPIVEPIRCLDPLYWILYNYGVIDAA